MRPTAIVTGASSGIGEAIALELAQKGFNLGLIARRQDLLEAVSQKCHQFGVETLTFSIDLSDLDSTSLKGAVEGTVARFGGVKVLVNNAGVYVGGSIESIDLSEADKSLRTNLFSAMQLTQFCAPHLKAQKSGAIIFVSSVAGQMSFSGGSAYCSSKFGMRGLSGAVFEDLREYGIKVCSICPGYVNTGMPSGNLDSAKMIQPEDIAKTVGFIVDFPQTGCPTEITILPQRNPYRTDQGF